MADWDEIEQDIKSEENHWVRFSALSEQITHAYINLYVEKGREFGISKPIAKAIAYATLVTYIPIIMGVIAVVLWSRR